MALFLFLGNLKHGFPILLPIFIISTPKRAERRNFMSAIIHLMGRVTRDPVMQQGKNNGTEYISLDLATSQRSQNAQSNPENPYESVFYQCYLNKHLAERLSKAGVKKGTCLYIYGDLELHPFVYSQGQRAGQAGSGAKINVRDWQFCLSNKSEGDAGGNQAGAPPYNGGAATPGSGGYQNPGPQNGGYQNPAGAAQGGAYPANGNAAGNGNYPGGSNPSGGSYPNGGNGNAGANYPNNGNGSAGANYPNNGNGTAGTSYPNGGSNMGNSPQPANGGAPQGGSYQANAPAQNGSSRNQMYQQQRGNAQYGQTPPQGGFAGDGFTNIPEGMASQLPFTA
jgi:single-stranded DNA-binding protein